MISDYQSSSSSPKEQRLTKPSMCLSGCFSTSVHHEVLGGDDSDRIRTPRSPYAWLKLTAHELPEIRDRCRNLISRLGRSRRNHHQRNSSDFSYDLSSYALNFEDEYSRDDESFPLRNFSSRLPVSPPPSSAKYVSDSAAVRREIVAFS
ncbi:hypothetical protein L484_008530 [Morus notabilis]|uniref:Uncharacterized protein n=1 Tax=Morus notabilis TaxID=981085 RepID=W9RJD0_9ROSA|nr:uncharacterized protein LOC21391895 [Morus notabilis]EXB80750.1 hypothetical protein L484_008530 [Morus notabilis]